MNRWLLMLLMLSLPLQAATGLSLSPPPYRLGQSLQLTLQTEGLLPAEALDIKPLFTSFVIGQLRWQQDPQRQSTQWLIPLVPRLSGTVELPALQVGQERTAAQPLQIDLPPVPRLPNLNRQAAQLQGQLSRDHALVGQPLIYEARIWMHPGVQMASLTAPSLEGANISLLGEDEQTSELIQGQRVLSLLRRYLVVPEVPGEVRVFGAQAQGEELEDAQGLQLKASPLRLEAAAQTLKVTALPADAPELVANAVNLSQHWEPAQGPYRQGDPIIRVLTLELVQADPRRVPTLGLPQQAGLRSYEDGQQTQITLQGGELQIRQTLRQALIPVAGGDLSLPAIEITWWNALTQQSETSRLPAISLPVLALPAVTSATQDRPAPTVSLVWWGVLLPPLLALWCWRRRDRLPKPRWLALLWHSLRLLQASRQPDARHLHACLLAWARWRWPQTPPTCVEALPCYADFATQLDPLLAACFANRPTDWRWSLDVTRRLLIWQGGNSRQSEGLNPNALD